ncbi:MAG: hypothetical protein KC431_29800, partial [Myxococcales bacterium]|nr:hypothetical protein [Myxococcales bacterium]
DAETGAELWSLAGGIWLPIWNSGSGDVDLLLWRSDGIVALSLREGPLGPPHRGGGPDWRRAADGDEPQVFAIGHFNSESPRLPADSPTPQ